MEYDADAELKNKSYRELPFHADALRKGAVAAASKITLKIFVVFDINSLYILKKKMQKNIHKFKL